MSRVFLIFSKIFLYLPLTNKSMALIIYTNNICAKRMTPDFPPAWRVAEIFSH